MNMFTSDDTPSRLARIAPALFVLLWSTGFIGAKLGLPHADPMTFLFLRFVLVTALLAPLALIFIRVRPGFRAVGGQVVVGLLMHGLYLGGVFWAIAQGVSAGLAALIVGLQPALTACLVGPFLGERVKAAAAIGFPLGAAGVVLVVLAGLDWRVDALIGAEADWSGYAACGLALAGMSAALILQKRVGGGIDPWTAQWIQAAASTVLFGVAATALGEWRVEWTGDFMFALLWLALVLSVGAIALLTALIRLGAASQTASLFFLTPPVTALIAWPLFGETLGWDGAAGMALAIFGVWLARR